MGFLEAAKEACFPALVTYVVAVLLAHIFRRRNFNHLALLGAVSGLVVGDGIVAQFSLSERAIWVPIVIGSIVLFFYLFGLVAKRFPLTDAT